MKEKWFDWPWPLGNHGWNIFLLAFSKCVVQSLQTLLQVTQLSSMAVLNPIKLVVLNVPAGEVEWLQTDNNPEDPEAGSRMLPFGRELWMEADDFKVDVNKKWFRLAPGRTVRLKSAYIVEYVNHIEDEQGQVVEVHVNRVANSKSGEDTSGVKAKGTLHWVAASHAVTSEVRPYDRLFMSADPEGGEDANFMNNLNSIDILSFVKMLY